MVPVSNKRNKACRFSATVASKDSTRPYHRRSRFQVKHHARESRAVDNGKQGGGVTPPRWNIYPTSTPRTPARGTSGCVRSSSMESSSALAASPSVNSPPANGGSIDSSPIRFADVLVVSEALRELALVPKQPPGLDEPKASLVDRRFLMQPSKVKFIVQKRSEPLRKLGLEFRMEPGCVTVQDFVDRTRLASLGTAECDAAGRRGNMERPTGKIRFGSTRGGHASGSESLAGDRTDDEAEMCDVARCVSVNGRGRADELGGNACETDPEDGAGKLRSEVDPEPGSGTTVDRHRARDEAEGSLRKEGGRGEAGRRGVANDACPASDAGAWQPSRGMTMVYNTSQGWVYLHSVTEESVKLFERIESGIECEEYGIPAYAMSPDGLRAVRGMARLFSEGSNVTVSIEECIVRIAGTAQAVEDASRALEAVTRSTERTERLNGHWFWRGDPTGAEDRGVFPTYPMSLEVCHRLDQAYARYLEDGSTCATYMINGSCYEANFTTMIQRNLSSNRKRPIERLVPHRTEFPLARCPKQTISVTCFREGTAYSMVGVSKREEALVKSAVAQSMSLAVTKVEHIWNSFLWGHYAQNAQNIGNEMMLFHGAGSSALSQISRTGFDRRFAGCENGASFGLGCYFARDASYASRYALVSGGRQMIMAKVLVGRYTCGSPTMKRPPKVSPAGSRTYDSTVNDQHMPTIFVTYKDWQAYPMYLISFAGTSFPTR